MSYELLTNRKTENRHKNYRQVNDIFFLVVHWWDDKKGLSFDSNVNTRTRSRRLFAVCVFPVMCWCVWI